MEESQVCEKMVDEKLFGTKNGFDRVAAEELNLLLIKIDSMIKGVKVPLSKIMMNANYKSDNSKGNQDVIKMPSLIRESELVLFIRKLEEIQVEANKLCGFRNKIKPVVKNVRKVLRG